MTTVDAVALRVRSIRKAKGLSLADVERLSSRKIRAVVLGSYERGDRALSVRKAIEIAEFYGVPLSYLLERPSQSLLSDLLPVVDLRRMRAIISDLQLRPKEGSPLFTISTYIAGVVQMRNDWNGELLSIRQSDLTLLSTAMGISHGELCQILRVHRLLIEVK